MTETEVEKAATECVDVDSLKKGLLDLCSGIPDELPVHPGLDERYEKNLLKKYYLSSKVSTIPQDFDNQNAFEIKLIKIMLLFYFLNGFSYSFKKKVPKSNKFTNFFLYHI